MFEIPFVEIASNGQKQGNPAEVPPARIETLASIAKALEQAGWSNEWTMTGLSFMPKHDWHNREEAVKPANIRKTLDSLGIQERFRQTSSRTLLDVLAARSEYCERASYVQADQSIRDVFSDEVYQFIRDDAGFLQEALCKMVETENLYGRKILSVENDYQRGILKGRLQALEWLLGREWPDLNEDIDEWDREQAEDERSVAIVSRAVETMRDVLFEKQVNHLDGTEKLPAAPINETGSGITVSATNDSRESSTSDAIAKLKALRFRPKDRELVNNSANTEPVGPK